MLLRVARRRWQRTISSGSERRLPKPPKSQPETHSIRRACKTPSWRAGKSFGAGLSWVHSGCCWWKRGWPAEQPRFHQQQPECAQDKPAPKLLPALQLGVLQARLMLCVSGCDFGGLGNRRSEPLEIVRCQRRRATLSSINIHGKMHMLCAQTSVVNSGYQAPRKVCFLNSKL